MFIAKQIKGKPILAKTLNVLINDNNKRAAANPGTQVDAANRASRAKRFTITAVDGDYLVCTPAGVGSTKSINVARPPLLQRRVTSHNGIVFTYTNDQTRSADATETQVIVPAYVVGDEIYAFGIIGGSGVTSDDGTAVTWLDANADARFWAKQSA
jgi:hypothetical protein